MAQAVYMPAISEIITQAKVVAWRKHLGDRVVEGDILAELETDKATIDFEAPCSGTVLHLGAKEGNTLNAGELLLVIGQRGENIAAILEAKANGAAPDSDPTSPSSSDLIQRNTAPKWWTRLFGGDE